MERISEILFDLIIVLAPSMKSSAPVKRKIRHTSPFGLGGCQGPVFWAFISTLDSPSQPHIMERGTKRNEVQLSFVPWAEGFVFGFC